MKEILLKVDEIVDTIKRSETYQKYLHLQELMENNLELKDLINDIKILQKRSVKGENVEFLLEEKKKVLNDNPIYREYNNTIVEINNTLTIIENTLNNYFDKKIN